MKRKTINNGENEGGNDSLYTIGGVLKKLKVWLPYDPAIPILSIYPKKLKSPYYTDTNVYYDAIHNRQAIK
jgi:hypothetical protein